MASTKQATATGSSTATSTIVSIDYDDLVSFSLTDTNKSDELLQKIGQAFGNAPSCLGILLVTRVPSLGPKRRRLLGMAHTMAQLSDEQKQELVSEESQYQSGWSHGKEILQNGTPDTAKGSFYANPLVDDITKVKGRRKTIPRDVVDRNPGFFASNVWPLPSSKTMEALPELEPAFKDLGKLVAQTGRYVAKLCDAYVKRQYEEYTPENKLEQVLTESLYCKGRLLYYFPVDKTNTTKEGSATGEDFSDWCGWHNDHGSLTGLVPAMFLDEIGEEVPNPDPQAGLYVQSRSGKIQKVSIPPSPDSSTMAFQIGETSQIHSGGVLQATPHAVRGCASDKRIARTAFAVFLEPEFDGPMELPSGKTVQDVQDASIVLPGSVKTLSSRWKEGMNFGEFSHATFASFH